MASHPIFDEYFIVDERSISDLIIGDESTICVEHKRRYRACYEKAFENKIQFREVTQFAALAFDLRYKIGELQITDVGNGPQTANVPLAQIILWHWTTEGAQTEILKSRSSIFSVYFDSFPSIVVRILQKRQQQTDENPCPQPSSSPDDDLTVHIGDSQITVSAAWLMSLSPVTNRMLSTEMKEKQQRSITLDNLGVSMERFRQFLNALASVTAPPLQTPPFFPNPTNVLDLLKLADYFQVDSLKARCEMHLINCVEIPLIDRFLLIEPYRLDNLKMFFMHLNVDKLRIFLKANLEHLSTKMRAEFFSRICDIY